MTSVAVVGAASCSAQEELAAEELGRLLAQAGALVVTGGRGGVMAAACRGAVSCGGATLGLLPGESRDDANPWVEIAVPTGLGEGRNVLVVRAADAVVAVGGGYGTLSEIALALKLGRPVVGLGTWELRAPGSGEPDAGVRRAADPATAVALVLQLAGRSGTVSAADPL